MSGAGGAGFPTHAKWDRLDEVDHLLVNHPESEPNYYIDKWLGRERADEFGVTKRTNRVLVLDADVAAENTLGSEGRISVVRAADWDDDHETEPTATLRPDYVRTPLVTNPSFEGVVSASEPIVSTGDTVSAGEMIATPGGDVSNTQHASIDGVVEAVTDEYVEIHRETDARESRKRRTAADVDRPLYWTWCVEYGDYVTMTDWDGSDPTEYVCPDCR